MKDYIRISTFWRCVQVVGISASVLVGCGGESVGYGTNSNGLEEPEGPFPGTLAGEERQRTADTAEIVVRQAGDRSKLDGIDKSRLGVVFGMYSDGDRHGRYTWVVEPDVSYDSDASEDAKPGGIEIPSAIPATIDPSLLTLSAASPDSMIDVSIELRTEFSTSLETTDFHDFTVLDESAPAIELEARRNEAITQRMSEATAAQQSLLDWLAQKGINGSGLWITNVISATVPAGLLPELASHPDVGHILRDETLSYTWNGAYLKAEADVNDLPFTNAGYDGGRFNPQTGQRLSIAIMDTNFTTNHAVFYDGPGGVTSRIRSTWNCAGSPCSGGLPPPASPLHGNWCASAAAGDARDGQVNPLDNPLVQLTETGAAEEADMIFISTTSQSSTNRGLQQALTLGADVVSQSRGGSDGTQCDGVFAGWETAVNSAHSAGLLVVDSAGNNDAARPGTCQLSGLAEAPQGLSSVV